MRMIKSYRPRPRGRGFNILMKIRHALKSLDVGLSKNTFYVIEAQCANTSGFYDCDIEELVNHINKVPKNEKRAGIISRF